METDRQTRIDVVLFFVVFIGSGLLSATHLAAQPVPEPDEFRTFPGLKAGDATAFLYQSGPYDKPVVIPCPFDASEQTPDQTTQRKLYQLFFPFISAARSRGYDIWIVRTTTGQNIHEQAAEFAQAVLYAANRLGPQGKAMIAAYSLGGVTARIATARWEADAAWRQSLGLPERLPVSLVVFGDAPLDGATVSLLLQLHIWQDLPDHAEHRFNLNSCGGQQLLRFSYGEPDDLYGLNHHRFQETGEEIRFRIHPDAPGTCDRREGGGRTCVCEAGPAVSRINGDGWPHGPRMVAFSVGMPGPMMCYGDDRDLNLLNQSLCPLYPVPPPRAPRVGERMYRVRIPLRPDADVPATEEDLEGGSRLDTVLNIRECGPLFFRGICGGAIQFFAGTFIPYTSALPSGAPFYDRKQNTYQGAHARPHPGFIEWVLNHMDAALDLGPGFPRISINRTVFCPGDPWQISVTDGVPNREIRLFRFTIVNGEWRLVSFDPIGMTDAAGRFSATLSAPPPGRYWDSVGIAGEQSNTVSYEVTDCSSPAPRAPSELRGESVGFEIRLAWRDNSEDETGFRIQRRIGGEDEWPLLVGLPANTTSYVDVVPEPPAGSSVTYSYRVRAINDGGRSDFSNVVSFVVYREIPAGPPVQILPQGCVPTLPPTLSWNGVGRARDYLVRVGFSDYPILFQGVQGTSYTINQSHVFPPYQSQHFDWVRYDYRWAVKACNNVGCTGFSPDWIFGPSCPPVQFGPSGCTGNQPVISWSSLPGASNYRLIVSDWTDGGDDFVVDAYPALPSYQTDLSARAGRRLAWKVRAVYSGIPGVWSDYVQFTPSCVAPTVAAVSPRAGPRAGGTQITITGTGFLAGSTVTVGGVAATSVTVVNATTMTARTAASVAGSANVAVTLPNGPSGTRPNGYTYLAPTVFTDDPLLAGVTVVKAQHVSELRQAVNVLRAAAGLSAASWTDPTLGPGVTVIRAVHVQELRARLNEALAALGYATPPYSDPALTSGVTVVRRVHLEELRQRVRGVTG